LGSVQ
jgi:peptidoglycan/xylan/chitin deacetylase (PgdA/CDA1 family)